MTRDLRQYLQHPDKLFRRVRDEHGLLKLSQAAKDFHPGRGVYRSSYMNARRLAATETNIAYRTADHLRWQKMDFVVSIEIVLSNNHTIRLQPGEKTSDLPGQMRADGTPKTNAVRTLTDICDTLAGRYPKDFKFTGWHPHCRCHAVTILKTEEEMARDTRRILDGRQPSTDSANAVTDTPEAFKGWVENNRDRIANGHSLPYFIRDNAKYTGITTKQTRTAKTPLDIAAERHANRTIAQVRDIQFRWSRRLANRINFDAINVSDRGRYGRLIVMTSIAEKKEFNAAEFNLLYGIVVRHAQRTAKQIQEIRQRWDKRIIERAGETKQVAALRKVLEQQKITDISDVKRVMHAFYGQFPQEFNNVRVDFVSFDRPPLNGSFTMGYSIHDIEIAFNSNKGWEKKSPLDTIVKALDKIRTRDKMSLAQLRGVATIVHELLHQKASKYVRLKAHYSGDYKRTAMETMNELASRATVARFIRRLGGSTDGASQLIVKGNGYDKWIKRVLGFCKKAGVNPEKLGQEWAQTLTTEKYDTMDAQLYAFFKKHADKKGFTQGMDEVLAAFENEKSNTEWAAMIKKWFPNRKNQQ